MDCDEIDLSTRDTEASSKEEGENSQRNDEVDAQSMGIMRDNRPGRFYTSVITKEVYYDISNINRGIAIIFNHESFESEEIRHGTRKDGDDLKSVLVGLQFDVRMYMNLNADRVRDVLRSVAREDHTNNDCLLVTVMSHGKKGGKISAADYYYPVEEIWDNFLGDNCKSLIGKPKLFFIQASRGTLVDPGVVYKPKPTPLVMSSDDDEVDAAPTELVFVIPKMADLLVMYSTAEDHYAFRNTVQGSWFIQALCEELKSNSQEDLLFILTGVNRRVAFAKQANVFENKRCQATKQMPNFVSMLTKTMYFPPKKN